MKIQLWWLLGLVPTVVHASIFDIIDRNFDDLASYCQSYHTPQCDFLNEYINVRPIGTAPDTGDALNVLLKSYLTDAVFTDVPEVTCKDLSNIARGSSCIESGFSTNEEALQLLQPLCGTEHQLPCANSLQNIMQVNSEFAETFQIAIRRITSYADYADYIDSLPEELRDVSLSYSPVDYTEIESGNQVCLNAYAGIAIDDLSVFNEVELPFVPFVTHAVIMIETDNLANADVTMKHIIPSVFDAPILKVLVHPASFEFDESAVTIDIDVFNEADVLSINSAIPLVFSSQEYFALQLTVFRYDAHMIPLDIITEEVALEFLSGIPDILSPDQLIVHVPIVRTSDPASFTLGLYEKVELIGNIRLTLNTSTINDLTIRTCSRAPLDSIETLESLGKLVVVNECKHSYTGVSGDEYVDPILVSDLLALSPQTLHLDGVRIEDTGADIKSIDWGADIYITGFKDTHSYTVEECSTLNAKGFTIRGSIPQDHYRCILDTNDGTMMDCMGALCVPNNTVLWSYMSANAPVDSMIHEIAASDLENTFGTHLVQGETLFEPVEYAAYASLFATNRWALSRAYPIVPTLIYPYVVVESFDATPPGTIYPLALDSFALLTTLMQDGGPVPTAFYRMISSISHLLSNLGHLSITSDTDTDTTEITAYGADGKVLTFPTLLSYKVDYSKEIDCSFVDLAYGSPDLVFLSIHGNFVNCSNYVEPANIRQLEFLPELLYIDIKSTSEYIPLHGFLSNKYFTSDYHHGDPERFLDRMDSAFDYPSTYMVISPVRFISIEKAHILGVPTVEFRHRYKLLEYLRLVDCSLQGVMPSVPPSLRYVNLSYNPDLTGDIIDIFGDIHPDTRYFDIRSTGITGTITPENFALCQPEFEGVCIVSTHVNIDDCPPCEKIFT